MDFSNLVSPTQMTCLRNIASLASRHEYNSYLVGGFVRDALLNKPINDFDVVVEGDAVKLGRALIKRFNGRLTVHAPFKTATWYPADGPVDFIDLITARSEDYVQPAALPIINPGTLDDDLRRRDFTINAIAMRLDEAGIWDVVDPLNGRQDLQAGLVRVMHPRSFIDDPTRLFRLFRYSIRYGFTVETKTEALIAPALVHVNDLTPERLRHELELIFEEPDCLPILRKLTEHQILQQVEPALPKVDLALSRLLALHSHDETRPNSTSSGYPQKRDLYWIAWLMGLQEEEIRLLAKRLHFTSNLLRGCLGAAILVKVLDSLENFPPSEIVARLEKIPDESIHVVSLCETDAEKQLVLQKYMEVWKAVKPRTKGETLMLMGVPFGPRIGDILWRLRAAWLDGQVTDEAGERALLDDLVREGKQSKK